MGLDQYLSITKSTSPVEQLEDDELVEIGYWRKHADLHGYVANLWCSEKRGRSPSAFNCVYYELTQEHLETILRCSKQQDFEEAAGTLGFFFGESTPEKHEKTVAIMTLAKTYMSEGYRVIYDGWW